MRKRIDIDAHSWTHDDLEAMLDAMRAWFAYRAVGVRVQREQFRPVEAVTQIATSSVGYGRILRTDPSWGCGNE